MFQLNLEFKLVIVLISIIEFLAVLFFEKKLVESFVAKCEKEFE